MINLNNKRCRTAAIRTRRVENDLYKFIAIRDRHATGRDGTRRPASDLHHGVVLVTRREIALIAGSQQVVFAARTRTMIIFYARAVLATITFQDNCRRRRRREGRNLGSGGGFSSARAATPFDAKAVARRPRVVDAEGRCAVYGMGSSNPKQPLIRPFCEIATLTIFQTPFRRHRRRRRADISLSILSAIFFSFFSPFFFFFVLPHAALTRQQQQQQRRSLSVVFVLRQRYSCRGS